MDHTDRESPTPPTEQLTSEREASALPTEQLEPAAPALPTEQLEPAAPLVEQTGTSGGIVGSLRTIAGWICIVAGLMTVCLPIPIGLPLIALGVFLIGPDSPIARRVMGLMKKGLKREQ